MGFFFFTRHPLLSAFRRKVASFGGHSPESSGSCERQLCVHRITVNRPKVINFFFSWGWTPRLDRTCPVISPRGDAQGERIMETFLNEWEIRFQSESFSSCVRLVRVMFAINMIYEFNSFPFSLPGGVVQMGMIRQVLDRWARGKCAAEPVFAQKVVLTCTQFAKLASTIRHWMQIRRCFHSNSCPYLFITRRRMLKCSKHSMIEHLIAFDGESSAAAVLLCVMDVDKTQQLIARGVIVLALNVYEI